MLVCLQKRIWEGHQMPLSHSKCMFKNLQGTQTSLASSLSKGTISLSEDGVIRAVTLLLKCHPWISITENYSTSLSKFGFQTFYTFICRLIEQQCSMHSNKKIFFINLVKSLNILCPNISGYRQGNWTIQGWWLTNEQKVYLS